MCTSLEELLHSVLPSTSLRGLDGHLVASTLEKETVSPMSVYSSRGTRSPSVTYYYSARTGRPLGGKYIGEEDFVSHERVLV